MATRSVIAVRTGTARRPVYKATGGPWHASPVGEIMNVLVSHYNNKQAAKKLVLGEGRLVELFFNIQNLLDHYQELGCEHAYVFVPGSGWIHADLRQLEISFESVD